MNSFNGLTVLECKYCYNGWKVDATGNEPIFTSALKGFADRRAVDLYHERKLYDEMGLPVEICDAGYEGYENLPPYAGVTRHFSDIVYEGASKGNAILIAGGYCNYAPAIVGGLQRAIGTDKKIGVVWMDAHGDCQIAETIGRPVRLVGVPMSTMLGLTLEDYRKNICGLEVPVEGSNVLASDIRILGEDYAETLYNAGVNKLDGTAFDSEVIWTQAVENLASRVDTIFLSVDADILDPEFIPAYETHVCFGRQLEIVKRNIRIVMETGKVRAFSVYCVDFDHYKRGGEVTYESGYGMVKAGLESWK